jgi:hypothetical protein
MNANTHVDRIQESKKQSNHIGNQILYISLLALMILFSLIYIEKTDPLLFLFLNRLFQACPV